MKYAQIDTTAASAAPVIGFYLVQDADDPGGFVYGDLPPASALVEMTEAQWNNRMTASWYDPASKSFVAPIPSAPTLTQQAQAAMDAGLVVTLTGSVTLEATRFPTDVSTQTKINQVVNTLNTTGAFPGGASSYPMKDSGGKWHLLDQVAYKAIASAISSYVAPLHLIIDGNPLNATELPPSSVSITV